MEPLLSDSFRPISPQGERGGMTIVMALILLVVMSLAAFSLSRNAIRELATTGHMIQGDKAAEASDAGLDWFIVWSHPDNMVSANANASAVGNVKLAKAMDDLKKLNSWYTALSNDGLLANASRTWDRAALITSAESEMSTNDMVFDNTTVAAVYQAKNANKSPVIQRFDLQVRYLGPKDGPGASGGTDPQALGSKDLLWQVVSTGYASVPIGSGNYIRYQQRREVIGSQALAQAQAK